MPYGITGLERVKGLKMGPIGCIETSVHNYQYRLRNIPEERISQLSISCVKIHTDAPQIFVPSMQLALTKGCRINVCCQVLLCASALYLLLSLWSLLYISTKKDFFQCKSNYSLLQVRQIYLCWCIFYLTIKVQYVLCKHIADFSYLFIFLDLLFLSRDF